MCNTADSPMGMNTVQRTQTWYPDPIEREVPADAKSAITQALGTASVCWHIIDGERVFDSRRCEEVLDGLLSYLQSIEEPKLGLATTAQLLNELSVRAEIHGFGDYRTVDC